MSYTVLPSDFQLDRGGILDLWRQNLPEASADRYTWLYESGASDGWIVQSDDGAVIGATGLMRRRMRVFGRTVDAGHAIDLNVDRSHRTVGPAIGLQRAVTDAVHQERLRLVYGLPNRQSEPVLRRCGYRMLGPMERWVQPLRIGPQLRAKLGGRLARAAAALGDPLLRMRGPRRRERLPGRMRIEAPLEFDGRFDDLWYRVRDGFGVVGRRTSDYLGWRFWCCPGAVYETLCLVGPRDELLAYVVFHCRDGVAYVGDFLYQQPNHLALLLSGMLRRMRRRRVEAVVLPYLGRREIGRLLGRLGFWRRPPAGSVMVYLVPQADSLDSLLLLEPDCWHLTLADLDVDD